MTSEELQAAEERTAEHRRILKEAYGDRPLPAFTEEWFDLHQRRHIAPWPDKSDSPKHESLSLDCWCKPVVLNGNTVVHFESPDSI